MVVDGDSVAGDPGPLRRGACGDEEDSVTVEDAAQMALALPEVTEGQRHGTRTWSVKGIIPRRSSRFRASTVMRQYSYS
jgi:hypothetical protein